MTFRIRYDRSYLSMPALISETEYPEEDGMDVTLEADVESYAIEINSMPFALTGWKKGSRSYGVTDTISGVTVSDLSVDEDGNKYLDVEGVYRSGLSIVAFQDLDGNYILDGTADGRFDRIIRNSASIIGVELPRLFNEGGSTIPSAPDPTFTSGESELSFRGWVDKEIGVSQGPGTIYNVYRRGVVILTPDWKEVDLDQAYATIQFHTGDRGTLKDVEGWDSDEFQPSILGGDGQGIYSFRTDSSSFRIPYTVPRYVHGADEPNRFLSYWVRIDGGDLVRSTNPTNKGFIMADGVSGVFAGDGFADVYHPGDMISLLPGEIVRLQPVWTIAYTHRLTFDLTQAINEGRTYSAQIEAWMIQNGLTPQYDGDVFTYMGTWESIGPDPIVWKRMPLTTPPFNKYFQVWIAEKEMYDMSMRHIYGGAPLSEIIREYDDIADGLASDGLGIPPSLSICRRQPCTAQRVGLIADEKTRVYDCKIVAVWNCWRSEDQPDFPNVSIVYDDPDWEEPQVTIRDGAVYTNTSLVLPPSEWFTSRECFDTSTHAYMFYFDIYLYGTGKLMPGSETRDERPRRGGEHISVRSFRNWNVRIGHYGAGVGHAIEAGAAIRINVTGNILSSYYWGQFPGPSWEPEAPEGITDNSAYDYFYEDKADGNDKITWEMIQDKKAIWGPIFRETQTDGEISIIPVEHIGVPDVVVAEASWTKSVGAYLIRGDYTRSNSDNSDLPPMLDLGSVQSIDDTITSNLTEIPTVAYGCKNKFVLDLGTVRRLNVQIARVNPPDYDDNMSPYSDNTQYYDIYGNEIPKLVYLDGPDKPATLNKNHPGVKDKYHYASRWSNSRWYLELRNALDFWQNSQDKSGSQLGGFQIYLESPPDEDTKMGETDGLSDATGNRPLYPSFLYNAFMTGSISPSYDGQLLRVTIPMTISKMVSSSDSKAVFRANRIYKLEPGTGPIQKVSDNLYYVDSIKASMRMITTYSDMAEEWNFSTPTRVSGWVAKRQYYRGSTSTLPSESTKVGDLINLNIIRWEVQYDNGSPQKETCFAGDTINLAYVQRVTLTAIWAPVRCAYIFDREKGRIYYIDEAKGVDGTASGGKVYDVSEGDPWQYVMRVPEGCTRATYIVSGGGGRGANYLFQHERAYASDAYDISGGGGSSGQYLTGVHRVPGRAKGLLVKVGFGGGTDDDATMGRGGSTSLCEYTGDISADAEPVVPLSSLNPTYEHSFICEALGGVPGTTDYGGVMSIHSTADGGDPSTSDSLPGSKGEDNGSNKGGLGGSSTKKTERVSTATYRKRHIRGGGGGGAGGVHFVWYTSLVDGGQISCISEGGRGRGVDKGSKGTYGGGGGGGFSSSNVPSTRQLLYGGHGFAVVQFY